MTLNELQHRLKWLQHRSTDSSGCSTDSSGCSTDSSGCSTDSSGCSTDSSGCSTDFSGCSSDSSDCSTDSSGCSTASCRYIDCCAYPYEPRVHRAKETSPCSDGITHFTDIVHQPLQFERTEVRMNGKPTDMLGKGQGEG